MTNLPLGANENNCSITAILHPRCPLFLLCSINTKPHYHFSSSSSSFLPKKEKKRRQKMGLNSNRVDNLACHETTIRIPTEAMPPVEIHKVCLPPKQTTFQKLKHRLSEIFFPDDPLHRFKNQTWLRKLILVLQFFFPIFQWGPEYNVSLLRSDAISGLTIASLAIPQVRHVFQLLSYFLSPSLSFFSI